MAQRRRSLLWSRQQPWPRRLVVAAVLLAVADSLMRGAGAAGDEEDVQPVLSQQRVVFQLENGEFEFAFFPEVAPVTTQHIFTLVQLGLYTSNQIFRVDKGFVAQTSDVSGRLVPLTAQQKEHAYKNVPLEVQKGVKHHEGRLSMARGGSPDSGGSSIFICYGNAPHLDMQYGVFGQVTRGMDVLHELELLPTRKEGIFVMPTKRVDIINSWWYMFPKPHQLPLTVAGHEERSLVAAGGATGRRRRVVVEDDHPDTRDVYGGGGSGGASSRAASGDGGGTCEEQLQALRARFEAEAQQLQELRQKLLP